MPNFIQGTTGPGVYANINNLNISRTAPVEGSDLLMAAGYSPWGPVNQATYITGKADYARKFGGLNVNSHLGNALNLFFSEGGSQALVCRVVGAAAAVATLTIVDRAGSPLATIRVDAKYPSSTKRVYVTVEAGTIANTVKLTFDSPDLPVPVEVADNVKLTFTQSELEAIAARTSNLQTLEMVNERSNLVKVANLNSATAAPANLPALTARTMLANGSDDFAGLSAASFIGTDDGISKTGLRVFDSEEFGTGQVALPGVTTNAAHLAIAVHCNQFKRFGILDLPPGTDKDAAIAARRLVDSSYVAFYWPPTIEALDLAGSGVQKNYPVSGAVAGVFARAEAEFGVHKAPANYQLFTAVGVEKASNGSQQTDQATRALLNRNEVNVITPLPEQGIRVYGARPAASYGLVTAIHQQRVLNTAYYQLTRAYQGLVFAPLSADRIFREAISLSEQYLRLLYESGALTSVTGNREDAFAVICDPENNPPESLDQHQLYVDIGMHIVDMAEKIFLSINSVPLSTSLEVLRG
jgi:Bacteriophage tail sheath protein